MIKQISDAEIEEARGVLEDFTVGQVNLNSAVESGVYAIVNQASRWEGASGIIYKLRDASYPKSKNARNFFSRLNILFDSEKVEQIAQENGWRFHHEKRITPFLEYFRYLDDSWIDCVSRGNEGVREQVCADVNYIRYKTFSFWSLCLGGTKLLPIDIHIRRKLSELGMEIDKI